jgi:hypothetical protein
MKKRKYGSLLFLVVVSGLVVLMTTMSHAQSESGLIVDVNDSGINVYANTNDTSDNTDTRMNPVYSLDEGSGDLSINVTTLWLYYVETGQLPVLPAELIRTFGELARSLDFQGTASLFRNQTFLESFVSQVNSSFPEWLDRFESIFGSGESLLGALGVEQSSSSGSNAALIVGIVLAVVAVLVIGVGVVLIVVYRRKRARLVAGHQDKCSTSTYFDDALSLKSATTIALAADDKMGTLSRHSGHPAVADPVLQWVMDASKEANGSGSGSGSGCGSENEDSSPKSGRSTESIIPEFLMNLQFHWEELRVARALGNGACGKVYLARWNETPVAVKVLLDGSTFSAMDGPAHPHAPNPRRMLEEIKITAALRHPNVVQFMGFCLSPPSMAAEYCPRGSLYHVLHDPPRAPISWLRRVAFAADAAAGMLHLHSRNPLILHRDLNSPNLLVAADWTIKVADMGLSKLLTDSALERGMNSIMTSGGGVNPRWLAPEILRGENCTKASDVFSFGVVMWEILTRRVPWEGETTWAIVGQVQSGGRLQVDDETVDRMDDMDDASKEQFIGLMQKCWNQDPEQRPDFGLVAQSLRELQKRILDAL